MFEGGSAEATVLRSEAIEWSIADYKSKYANFFDARGSIAMFSDGRSTVMYDPRGVKPKTDADGWNRGWELMSHCLTAALVTLILSIH